MPPGIGVAAEGRASAIAGAGSLADALAGGGLPRIVTVTVTEAVILGLIQQGVHTFFVVLGHGSTELGETLRRYHEAGVLRTVPCRSEIEASHAATSLRWVTGEPAAVVTSIGPGAMQAASASLAAASDGIGVWHIYGDETTRDEGPNMQQVPGQAQHSYLKLLSHLGASYVLHTPEAVVPALRRGLATVDHPYRQQPFFLLLPINVQPSVLVDFDLARLPIRLPVATGPAAPEGGFTKVARMLADGQRVAIKVGRGAAGCGTLLEELAELCDAVFVMSPSSLGIVPSDSPRQMTVGGSKGSISGNYAMEQAQTLIVVGSRGVCQSDCSRTGYPHVTQVVNLNAELHDSVRYGNSVALLGDVRATLESLLPALRAELSARASTPVSPSEWLIACQAKRAEWEAFKDELQAHSTLADPVWGRAVLTQPAAIKTVLDWAHARGHRVFFDAGDVQANGFQLAEVNEEGWFYTESGASYMGFGPSALLAGGVARHPFFGVALCGDGSFVMSPQILIDAVHTGTRGAVVILDNRRMAAISSLQVDQYGRDFATSDGVAVDYVQWADSVEGVLGIFGGTSTEELRVALETADTHDGLSVIHVPVYFGDSPFGGLGSYGRWNVGSWVEDVQALIERTVI